MGRPNLAVARLQSLEGRLGSIVLSLRLGHAVPLLLHQPLVHCADEPQRRADCRTRDLEDVARRQRRSADELVLSAEPGVADGDARLGGHVAADARVGLLEAVNVDVGGRIARDGLQR